MTLPLWQQTRWRHGGAISLAVVIFVGTLWSLLPHNWTGHAEQSSPPWIYGRPDARFTIIEYADFECPYCRSYFPTLRHWIDEHPDTNWQWSHLPLPMHEPAATQEAKLAECAGAVAKTPAFWRMAEWIYRNTRGDGAGLPTVIPIPGMSPRLSACLNTENPIEIIRAQQSAAVKAGIAATPTLRLIDHRGGAGLILQGPVGSDALSSAVDFLASGSGSTAAQ